jgi:peptide/nickel transport system substrate-binding protein
MKTRHRTLNLLLLFVIVALISSGCATGTQQIATTVPEATQAPSGTAGQNVFVYAIPAQFPDLDPAKSYSNDSVVTSNCYETLTFYNPPGSKELLSPKLATSWEANSDATEWTFHLRTGVTFQDSTPFNSAAVKYAVSKTKELGVGAAYIWDPVKEMDTPDDDTIIFKLSYSAPLDLIASSGYQAWMYSPTAYEKNGSDWFNLGNCAGTGPYSIESYERGARLVMTRNENYWGGWKPGQYSKIVFEISQDPVVNQQKIEAGTASFTYEIPPDNVAQLRQTHQDITVYTNPSFQNLVGLLNTKKPPLDNVKVRQALEYSFPYVQFIQGVMGDRAVQARGPVPRGMWGHGDSLPQYSYDLDKAKQLLTEAGYPNGGFNLLMTYSSGDLDEQQLGELWKAELAKLGINLEVRGMNWESQWDLGKSDAKKAQDIFVMYWWPDYISPYSFLKSMFYSEEKPLFNLDYYSNPTYDQMIDKANEIAGTDRAKASQMFIDTQKILIDDAVSMFFYDVSNTHLARTDVKGYVDNPAYPHVVFFYDLSQ